MTSSKARECVRFVISLVGSISGDQALDLEDAFEGILHGHPTPETTLARTPRKRRYNGRTMLDTTELATALGLLDGGWRPREVAERFHCSPSVFVGKALVRQRARVAAKQSA